MDVNDEFGLLQEYIQWRTAREVRVNDTSPEEFMRDRIKEVAVDRIEIALDYINSNLTTNIARITTIKEILEGTYDDKSGSNTENVGPESETTIQPF